MYWKHSGGLLVFIRGAVLSLAMAATTVAGPLTEPEKSFLASTRTSMRTMMAGMDTAPQGDVDQDFIAQMIPHHQGAIDMAKAELLYGRNEQLRRMAQEIIVEQQAEITVMRREQTPHPVNPARIGAH
jgi:uncharacterized protein (DUF305 family)